MRIVIITQNEPFYLVDNLKYLLKILPKHSEIVACIVSDPSPFGKKHSFLRKVKKTYDIFGLNFFIHYSKKYIYSKINYSNNIISFLKNNNIPRIVLDKSINNKLSVEKIKKYEPDLLISILGNEIFKKRIINLAPKGCLNLHTAFLPKYRGLMPTFWVLKNNERYTGVSVFYVDKGIDSGPIILQKKIEIGDKTQEELIRETKKLGMELIAESIDLIEKDKVEIIENNKNNMTYYGFPSKKDVKVFLKNKKRFF